MVAILPPSAYGDMATWRITIERPDDRWFSPFWREEGRRRGRLPDRIIRAHLQYPERLCITGETPAQFWARYREQPDG